MLYILGVRPENGEREQVNIMDASTQILLLGLGVSAVVLGLTYIVLKSEAKELNDPKAR